MACEPLTKEDFIELWSRVLPKSYTVPIEEEGNSRGLDVPCLQARIWELYCENLEVSQQAYFLLPHSIQTRPESQGEQKASGVVFLQRAAPVLGDVYLPIGTALEATVTDSFGEELLIGRYLTTAELTMPNGDGSEIAVPVEAEFAGYAGNIEPGLITRFKQSADLSAPGQISADDSFVEVLDPTTANDRLIGVLNRTFRFVGSLDSENANLPRRVTSVTFVDTSTPISITFDPPLDDPADIGKAVVVEVENYEDLGISVSQPDAIMGGVSGTLDAIGADRGQGRVPGETDDEYRFRLSELSDTISPNAIERILDCILTPCGIRFTISEAGDINSLMGFTWDVHPYDFGQIAPVSKPPGSEYVGQGGVYLGESTYTRFFIITVSCPELATVGLFYDDGPFPNAYDDIQFYDGDQAQNFDEYNACIARAYEAVDAARAAGVGFIIVQDCNL